MGNTFAKETREQGLFGMCFRFITSKLKIMVLLKNQTFILREQNLLLNNRL